MKSRDTICTNGQDKLCIFFYAVCMVALLSTAAYLNHRRDKVRCTIDNIQRGGSLETGTNHDIWFNRNTNGEVWLRNGYTYCQIR